MPSDTTVEQSPKPRFTAFGLAHYILADDTEKATLIERARAKQATTGVRLPELRTTIQSALASPDEAESLLSTAAQTYEQKAADEELPSAERLGGRKGLAAIQALEPLRAELAGYKFTVPTERSKPLVIGGVAVLVNLDLIVHPTDEEREEIGGLVLQLGGSGKSKGGSTAVQRKKTADIVSTLIFLQVRKALRRTAKPAIDLCLLADLTAGSVRHLAGSRKKVRESIESACESISSQW